MTAQASGNPNSLLSPLTNALSGLLTGAVNLVTGLVGGVVNLLQTASFSITLNLVVLPQVNNLVDSVRQRVVPVLLDLNNADFKYPFFILLKNVVHVQAYLKSGKVPLTSAGIQDVIKSVTDLTQSFAQVTTKFNQLYLTPSNCSMAPACSNTSIQVADCSCYTSNEVSQFLSDFRNTYVPLRLKGFAFYAALAAADYTVYAESPETIQIFKRIGAEIQKTYLYIYQNNGQVNDTLVSSDFTALSGAINTLALTYPESIDTTALFSFLNKIH